MDEIEIWSLFAIINGSQFRFHFKILKCTEWKPPSALFLCACFGLGAICIM